MMEIRAMRPEDAHMAALLHMEGQPGTVLTALGEHFLTALYAKLCRSSHGIGFVATDGDQVMGIIAGTTDTHALFRELILKEGLSLSMPVAAQLVRKPGLFFRVLQTFAYPNKLEAQPGEAEFLFIGVSSQARRHGLGSRMFQALVAECQRRGATGLKSTVDASNPHANAFHVKWGFEITNHFDLYGRKMNLYLLDLRQPPKTKEG